MEPLSLNHFTKLAELFYLVASVRLNERDRNMMESRLRARLNSIGLNSFGEYLFLLKKFPQEEIPIFISLMTTHHTFFFRENSSLAYLSMVILPKFFDAYYAGGIFRVWCGGCATGQEPYSVAMIIDRFLVERQIEGHFEILGTDVDSGSINTAQAGLYPVESLTEIPLEMRENYTRSIGDTHFEIDRKLCSHVRFLVHSLGQNVSPMETKLQFNTVLLRNLLIYFSPESIQAVLTEVLEALGPGGTLMTGESDPPLESPLLHHISNCIYIRRRDGESAGEGESAIESEVKPAKRIRVLLVDDSKSIHLLFKQVLNGVLDIEIIGEAYNGQEALDRLRDISKQVDVIICDIHMPVMDGVIFLELQMKEFRIPTIMLSSIAKEDAVQLLRAYEKGAVDYIEKPRNLDIRAIQAVILQKIREIASANIKGRGVFDKTLHAPLLDIVLARPNRKLILMGASTGGPETLARVLESFPRECPPVVIAQHMPPFFTKVFAERLATRIGPSVKEAFNRDALVPAHVYVAPGDANVTIKSVEGVLRIELNSEQRSYTPSVDMLFESGARLASDYSVLGVILTGMGVDGAEGVRALYQAGGHVIVQDEKSSIAVGMPKAAIQTNCVDSIVPVDEIAAHIFNVFKMQLTNTRIRMKEAA